jgi:dipeptidyl aminopeptidase/acylaminoacyl peptidase
MISLDLTPHAPWRERFRAAGISWARVATAHPGHGVVCTNLGGVSQLHAWDLSSGSLNRLTSEPTGVGGGTISADGRFVYFLKDKGGNEIGHYVRIPFAGGEEEDITPEMPLYSTFGLSQSCSGSMFGFIAAGPDGYHAHVLRPGAPSRVLYHSTRISRGPILTHDGEIAVVASSERSGTMDFSLLAFDVQSGALKGELWDGDGVSVLCGPPSPVAGDFRFLATTSRSGLDRPLIWNPQTGERRDLALDGIPGTVEPVAWSPDAGKVLLCQLYQARSQLYLHNLGSESVTMLRHPPGVVSGIPGSIFRPDGELWINWQDASHPPCLIALDGNDGSYRRTILHAGDAPPGRELRAIEFPSEQGDRIHGWLAVPEGAGPFPTILQTHGGPTAVATLGFSPSAQAWLDHGFAYCTINYHGSVTFGRDFEKSIWGNLGELEVQDMAGAWRWLVENKIARSNAVLITGGSYGGYLTLQAMGCRPDLWAGGMASVAIADWKTMYEDEAETLRGYQRALFGGAPDEVPDATRRSSPITHADWVAAPILVIQGANDTRCPARQMRAYEDLLRSLGKEITVHWFDAGHGSAVQETQIEHQELMLRFAARVLGQR